MDSEHERLVVCITDDEQDSMMVCIMDGEQVDLGPRIVITIVIWFQRHGVEEFG